jgi:hypothetical protein
MDSNNTFKSFHSLRIAPLEIQASLSEHLPGIKLNETLTIEDIKSIASRAASGLHPEYDHASSLQRMKQMTLIHQHHAISIMRNQPLSNLPVFITQESEGNKSQEKSKPDPDIDALFCEW